MNLLSVKHFSSHPKPLNVMMMEITALVAEELNHGGALPIDLSIARPA